MNTNVQILVVDDDPYLLDLMIETLTTIGYKAIGAQSGHRALEFLENGSFDLVITDIKMPEMDGLVLSETIRKIYPRLPVIFISGAFTPSVLEAMKGQPFLAKPFRINQLEQMIADTLIHRTEDGAATTVLIVDDDDGFRYMLTESLGLSGYRVVAVSDGERAISRLKQGNIGVVITDIKMPGMDGLTLARYIRREWPKITVILITAYYRPEAVEGMESPDADGYLMKPFRIESITGLLENIRKKKLPVSGK